jgi:uncharacterized glyoxalase superfamily protein PhnB
MSDTKAPPPSVWPALRATDAHGLIKFLTEALGFEATVVYADGDTVRHAELAWPPGGGIVLGSQRPDAPHPASGPGTSSTYAVTDDLDALHDRAVAYGAKVVTGLYDTDPPGGRPGPPGPHHGRVPGPPGVSRSVAWPQQRLDVTAGPQPWLASQGPIG